MPDGWRVAVSVAAVLTISTGVWGTESRGPKRLEQYGFTRLSFRVAGAPAFIILPAKQAESGRRPWAWYAPTIGAYPNRNNGWLLSRLLQRGFAVCGVNVGESYGSPKGVKTCDAFYEHVVKEYGLSPKACLLPQSRGGLMLYNWAASGDNARRVACIGGIYPVCDLRSWPGLARACPAYGLTAEQLGERLADHNPIDRLAPLARAKVPILHLHGDADTVVPLGPNSQELIRRYQALGGRAELIIIPGKGHAEVPAYFHSEQLLAFFLAYGPKAD